MKGNLILYLNTSKKIVAETKSSEGVILGKYLLNVT